MLDYTTFSGIVLILSLGLRHGLDPDHIAAIDGITYRSLETRPGLARWVGSLFALGHGLVVTVIALAVSFLGQRVQLPEHLFHYAEWLPVVLLLLIGTLNLSALLKPQHYQAVGWKCRLLPRRLREATHPLAILLVGVFFALVFDTATQAATWGYAATAAGGVTHALVIGAIFTFGMFVTDTIDGRLLCKMSALGQARGRVQTYRRGVGWMIVIMAYSVAGYQIASRLIPGVALDEIAYSLIGLSFILVLPLFYLLTQRIRVAAG